MIVYGLTIALQLSGALLLMGNYWGNVETLDLNEIVNSSFRNYR